MGYQLEKENLIKPKKKRPLRKAIVETSYESDTTLVNSLVEKGLKVIEDRKLNVFKIECDVVIVGSGCGGVAVVVLVKSGQKVVVVEKGHYFVAEDYSSLEGPSLSQLYESGEVLSTLHGKCMKLAGSTVGGGLAVNWSASIKIPTSLLKKWALDHKILFFGTSDYVYAMDIVCKIIGVTERCSKEGFYNQVLKKVYKNYGLKVEYLPWNCSEDHSCSSYCYGCEAGDKRGTDITWLVDAVILTGCKAERFILEKNHSVRIRKKKCVGLITSICSNKKITKRLEIKAKVMRTASGSLLTSPLMLSSGLKNPNIRKNLHLHPILMVWRYFPETLTNLPGKTFQGGIITSLHKILSHESEFDVQTVIEEPTLGPASFGVLLPWVSGHDTKKKLL
ncbi:hypothetical protein GIB67_021103 [Kingdonia uniflora]|uniref:Glucose-methanol-choline oxidoreductase N-terminal domain-containing protein n=1 Tax=Kingdonia uniflora TaxID=39325 RepID=A0A7J7N7F2_9MAGN|nr:hypothetical protein GIB67_021103 [Kingdonia uniflora]